MYEVVLVLWHDNTNQNYVRKKLKSEHVLFGECLVPFSYNSCSHRVFESLEIVAFRARHLNENRILQIRRCIFFLTVPWNIKWQLIDFSSIESLLSHFFHHDNKTKGIQFNKLPELPHPKLKSGQHLLTIALLYEQLAIRWNILNSIWHSALQKPYSIFLYRSLTETEKIMQIVVSAVYDVLNARLHMWNKLVVDSNKDLSNIFGT
jgi:hypothetical protein